MDWREESLPFFLFFFLCREVQQQQQQQQWGLQWEKYRQHYEVGLSLPSLSMRGKGLSQHTKEKKDTSPDKE